MASAMRPGAWWEQGDDEEPGDESWPSSAAQAIQETRACCERRRPGTKRSGVRNRRSEHYARHRRSGNQWSSCPPLRDFAGRNPFAKPKGSGQEAPVVWPRPLGLGGRGVGVGRSQGRLMKTDQWVKLSFHRHNFWIEIKFFSANKKEPCNAILVRKTLQNWVKKWGLRTLRVYAADGTPDAMYNSNLKLKQY